VRRSEGTHRRVTASVLALVTALLVSLTACTGSTESTDPPAERGSAEAIGLSPRTDSGASQVTEDVIASSLASVGVAVVDPDTGDPLHEVAGEPSSVTVSVTDLPAAAAGVRTLTGLTSAQLDGLATWPAIEGPVDDLTPSVLITGWLLGATTPAADLGRTWMGAQDLRQHADLVFPAAVLDLFLADVLPRGTPSDASPAAYVAAASDQSVCEQFQSFVNDSIAKVFDAIGRLPNVSGDSVWTDILNGVIDLLNLGKDALRFFVVNGTKVLLKPVVDAVASVASVVALATFAVKTVLPWTGEILPEPGAPTLGTAPVEGHWTLSLESPGPEEWPAQVKGCARWAGVELPSLKPDKADVTWAIVSQQPATLVQPGAADAAVRPDATARMSYATLVEPPEVASGKERFDGTVRIRATVHRTDLGRFTDSLLKVFLGFLPTALPQLVTDTIAGVLRPVIDQALDRLSSIRDLTVAGFLFPVYHEKEEETPTPTPTPSPSGKTFCGGFVAMIEWREAQGTGGLDRQVTLGQVRRLRAIMPLGTAQQAHDAEVLAIIWQMWAEVDATSPTKNPGAIGQAMVDLGYVQSAKRLARQCGVALERIGAG